MKYSIIIPIYNAEQFIDCCVTSVLRQHESDYELLLVDDGSTDHSLAVCQRWASQDSRIKVLSQSNGGVSAARNTGLRQACGEWICFVDADDELTDDYLENFNRCMNDKPADWYISGFYWLNEHQVRRYVLQECVYTSQEKGRMYLTLKPQGVFGIPWNKCFKSAIIKANNLQFDVRIHRAEDELFNLQYLLHVQSVYTSSALTYKYYRFNYATGANKFSPFDERCLVADLMKKTALRLSNEEAYQECIEVEYVNYILLAIKELYTKIVFPSFTRSQRLAYIEKVRSKIIELDRYMIYKSLLRRHYFFFDNRYMIDFMGYLLYLRDRFLK